MYVASTMLNAARRRAVLAAALLSGVLAMGGCSLFSSLVNNQHMSRPPAQSQAADAATPQHGPGLDVKIFDPETGTELPVTLGESYVAASSRPCSKYYNADTYGTGAKPVGVACKDESGRWVRIPLHVRDGFAE